MMSKTPKTSPFSDVIDEHCSKLIISAEKLGKIGMPRISHESIGDEEGDIPEAAGSEDGNSSEDPGVLSENDNGGIYFRPDERSILIAAEEKAAETIANFGASFKVVFMSLEEKTHSSLCCDLMLRHCTTKLRELILVSFCPVNEMLTKVENLLDKFGPALHTLTVQKDKSDDSDRVLKKQLTKFFNDEISKCKKLEALILIWKDGYFEGDSKFLESVGRSLKNLDLNIPINPKIGNGFFS